MARTHPRRGRPAVHASGGRRRARRAHRRALEPGQRPGTHRWHRGPATWSPLGGVCCACFALRSAAALRSRLLVAVVLLVFGAVLVWWLSDGRRGGEPAAGSEIAPLASLKRRTPRELIEMRQGDPVLQLLGAVQRCSRCLRARLGAERRSRCRAFDPGRFR